MVVDRDVLLGKSSGSCEYIGASRIGDPNSVFNTHYETSLVYLPTTAIMENSQSASVHLSLIITRHSSRSFIQVALVPDPLLALELGQSHLTSGVSRKLPARPPEIIQVNSNLLLWTDFPPLIYVPKDMSIKRLRLSRLE